MTIIEVLTFRIYNKQNKMKQSYLKRETKKK